MTSNDYRSLSFWNDSAPEPLEPRTSLAVDEQVDVAIVGAGYTGVWTAYQLKALDPGLRVAIAEAEIVGFGASGRNGGWCVGSLAEMARPVSTLSGQTLTLNAFMPEGGRRIRCPAHEMR